MDNIGMARKQQELQYAAGELIKQRESIKYILEELDRVFEGKLEQLLEQAKAEKALEELKEIRSK
jgi:hypothetical protein